MTITRLIPTSVAALALALPCAGAFAASKVETASFSAASTDTAAQVLQLALFDPTLGTLDAATLSFSGSLVSSSQVANNSAALNLTNVTVSLFGDLTATRQAGAPAVLPAGVDLFGANSSLGSRTFVILGPNARTAVGPFTNTAPAANHTFVFTAPTDLQSLVGTGSFGYSFASSTSASVPARFTSVSLLPSSLSSATVTLQYTYTPTPTPTAPVPEPQTWALMLAGIGACGFVLRRRGAQA